MSEDFTLYRGQSGTPHLVAFRCAHRGTQLSTGWVEGDCIRCFYHGWKYDGAGQCVEQPAEDSSFPPKVKIVSYPTEEYLGLIFAYLGDAEHGDTGAFRPPPLPRYPDFGSLRAYWSGIRILATATTSRTWRTHSTPRTWASCTATRSEPLTGEWTVRWCGRKRATGASPSTRRARAARSS